MNRNYFLNRSNFYLTIISLLFIGNWILQSSFILKEVKSPLKVASFKVDITPNPGDSVYCMKGFAAIENIHDPIYARVLIMSQDKLQVLMVSLDLLYFGDDEVQVLDSVIRKKTGINNILISNTHSHSGFFVPKNLPELGIKISSAIVKERKHLVPVSYSYASTMIDEVYNRRVVKDGKVTMLWQNPNRIYSPASDSSLTILSFQDSKGKHISSLVDYTAHPVITMNFDKVEVSSDYPGVLTNTLDKQLGGTSLFVLGAAGDLNPYDAGIGPEKGSFEKANHLGDLLANKTITAWKETNESYADAHLVFNKKTVDVIYKGKPKKVDIYSVALSNEIAIVGLPGELFSELGVSIKKDSPFKHTIVMGYTGSTSIGYVPTLKAAEEGGYGAENVPVERGTGELLVSEAVNLLLDVKESY